MGIVAASCQQGWAGWSMMPNDSLLLFCSRSRRGRHPQDPDHSEAHPVPPHPDHCRWLRNTRFVPNCIICLIVTRPKGQRRSRARQSSGTGSRRSLRQTNLTSRTSRKNKRLHTRSVGTQINLMSVPVQMLRAKMESTKQLLLEAEQQERAALADLDRIVRDSFRS